MGGGARYKEAQRIHRDERLGYCSQGSGEVGGARHRETKAFSTEEIRLILTSASAIKNTKRPAMAARRWVPWICAYSGARAGEITQLRHQDVIERDGIKITNILLSRGFSTISKPKAPDRFSTTRPQPEQLAPTSPTLSARRLFKCVAVLANGCAPRHRR